MSDERMYKFPKPWHASGMDCPYCGTELEVIVDDLYYPDLPYPGSAGYIIGCGECGTCTDWHETEDDARQAAEQRQWVNREAAL